LLVLVAAEADFPPPDSFSAPEFFDSYRRFSVSCFAFFTGSFAQSMPVRALDLAAGLLGFSCAIWFSSRFWLNDLSFCEILLFMHAQEVFDKMCLSHLEALWV
jgi:hypothetical protein